MPAVSKSFSLCVPVLEYHRIIPKSEAGNSLAGLVMAPETFSSQLDALKAAGWRSITLGRLGDDLVTGRSPGSKIFVITIDDGWSDGYKYAFPILKAHGFVATFFVVSSRIGGGDMLSASNLSSLVGAGNEIGNHTEQHVAISYLAKADMIKEVNLASDRIAQVVGIRPKSFAYPMGGINATAMTVVAACPGMEIAVTEQYAIGETNGGRFDVPRLELGPGVSAQALMTMLGR